MSRLGEQLSTFYQCHDVNGIFILFSANYLPDERADEDKIYLRRINRLKK
jgi:hypothetical protein